MKVDHREIHEGLGTFLRAIPSLAAPYHGQAARGSRGWEECNHPTFGALTRDSHSLAITTLEVAYDHMVAFVRLTGEPPLCPIAAATCVRGALEASVIIAWLFDRKVTVEERLRRTLSLRYEGLVQQRKLQDDAGCARIDEEIEALEWRALGAGFARVRGGGERSSRTGIGMVFPGITELTGAVLDHQRQYRLLSAAAHGHRWAIHQIAFKALGDDMNDRESVRLEKHAHPDVFEFCALTGMITFTRALIDTWLMLGWDWPSLVDLIERAHVDMKLPKPNILDLRHGRKNHESNHL